MGQDCSKSQVSLFKIGIVFERKFEVFFSIQQFSRVAMNFADFICSTRIQRIKLQFFLELGNRRVYIFGGICRAPPGQERSPKPIVDASTSWLNRYNLAVFSNGRIVRTLAFVGLGSCLVCPN